jgi:multidrug efflux pump subunit AcrB
VTSIKARIQQVNKLKAAAKQQKEITAQTVRLSATGIRLGDLADVDTSHESDGVMMIYNGQTGKYEVTTQIQNKNLNIIGGTY